MLPAVSSTVSAISHDISNRPAVTIQPPSRSDQQRQRNEAEPRQRGKQARAAGNVTSGRRGKSRDNAKSRQNRQLQRAFNGGKEQEGKGEQRRQNQNIFDNRPCDPKGITGWGKLSEKEADGEQQHERTRGGGERENEISRAQGERPVQHHSQQEKVSARAGQGFAMQPQLNGQDVRRRYGFGRTSPFDTIGAHSGHSPLRDVRHPARS